MEAIATPLRVEAEGGMRWVKEIKNPNGYANWLTELKTHIHTALQCARTSLRYPHRSHAMTDQRIAKRHHATFESIRQQDTAGNEYWSARKLAKVAGMRQQTILLTSTKWLISDRVASVKWMTSMLTNKQFSKFPGVML